MSADAAPRARGFANSAVLSTGAYIIGPIRNADQPEEVFLFPNFRAATYFDIPDYSRYNDPNRPPSSNIMVYRTQRNRLPVIVFVGTYNGAIGPYWWAPTTSLGRLPYMRFKRFYPEGSVQVALSFEDENLSLAEITSKIMGQNPGAPVSGRLEDLLQQYRYLLAVVPRMASNTVCEVDILDGDNVIEEASKRDDDTDKRQILSDIIRDSHDIGRSPIFKDLFTVDTLLKMDELIANGQYIDLVIDMQANPPVVQKWPIRDHMSPLPDEYLFSMKTPPYVCLSVAFQRIMHIPLPREAQLREEEGEIYPSLDRTAALEQLQRWKHSSAFVTQTPFTPKDKQIKDNYLLLVRDAMGVAEIDGYVDLFVRSDPKLGPPSVWAAFFAMIEWSHNLRFKQKTKYPLYHLRISLKVPMTRTHSGEEVLCIPKFNGVKVSMPEQRLTWNGTCVRCGNEEYKEVETQTAAVNSIVCKKCNFVYGLQSVLFTVGDEDFAAQTPLVDETPEDDLAAPKPRKQQKTTQCSFVDLSALQI